MQSSKTYETTADFRRETSLLFKLSAEETKEDQRFVEFKDSIQSFVLLETELSQLNDKAKGFIRLIWEANLVSPNEFKDLISVILQDAFGITAHDHSQISFQISSFDIRSKLLEVPEEYHEADSESNTDLVPGELSQSYSMPIWLADYIKKLKKRLRLSEELLIERL
jgi:hypothetical protein